MRWQNFVIFVVFASVLAANAEPARVIKVLPHFLDLKGRASLNPSFFDRDAYQVELRAAPARRSGLRFDVQWKAPYYAYDALRLRIEAKGAKGKEPKTITVEEPVKPTTLFSAWTAVTLSGEDYKDFGELISWRATLLNGTNVVAEQKSFLW